MYLEASILCSFSSLTFCSLKIAPMKSDILYIYILYTSKYGLYYASLTMNVDQEKLKNKRLSTDRKSPGIPFWRGCQRIISINSLLAISMVTLPFVF